MRRAWLSRIALRRPRRPSGPASSGSENYGHSIVEALLCGTPVLISDSTPWRGLEAEGVGWDLPIADEAAFVRALREAEAASSQAALEKRARTRAWAETRLDLSGAIGRLRACLEEAIASA